MKPTTKIQAEFDRIALVEAPDGWNHNDHYHSFLLQHVPAHCRAALDVGCGTGVFTRLLAQRSERVLALDLSPEMLRIARQRSTAYPQIEYLQANVMEYQLPGESFDCIASIATLHHMALPDVLPILKAALKPGGTLLVLDLYQAAGIGDLLPNLVSVPYHLLMKQLKGGNRQSPEAAAAWEAHGRDDHYPGIGEVRRACASLLPGAKVTRHLLWRYSLVWKKS